MSRPTLKRRTSLRKVWPVNGDFARMGLQGAAACRQDRGVESETNGRGMASNGCGRTNCFWECVSMLRLPVAVLTLATLFSALPTTPAGDENQLKPINLDKINTAADEVDPFA